jgi:phosphopantothenoylcysteine decarboxylase/phosphopantothenate--cysteine ligase
MSSVKTSRRVLNVCIAVSGGIAAYKIPLLIRVLRKKNCEVKVVLTNAARPLVGSEALKTLSGNPVYSDIAPSGNDIEHISLAQWADVLCICPATANTIAKLAHGIADNLLTTLALAFDGPVVVAPAMNSAMWLKKVTQKNIRIVESLGMRVLPVDDGELACGTKGPGRMLDIQEIARHILAAVQPRLLNGKRILIASGPTVEPIDPVRVITNRSSGKMGSALASEALMMGAEVTVVTGPSAIPMPTGVTCINVNTASEMSNELDRCFKDADVCIMAAAVSDYRINRPSSVKLKRDKGAITLQLVPNPDILARLGEHKKNQLLVGFALEDKPDINRAIQKMRKKNCDLMVLNVIKTALGADSTDITLIAPGARPRHLGPMDKKDAAGSILTHIAHALGKANV